jgi:hypothetical protein
MAHKKLGPWTFVLWTIANDFFLTQIYVFLETNWFSWYWFPWILVPLNTNFPGYWFP